MAVPGQAGPNTCPGRLGAFLVQTPNLLQGTTLHFSDKDLSFTDTCQSIMQNAYLPEGITGCQDAKNCFFTCDFEGNDANCCMSNAGGAWTAQHCTGVKMDIFNTDTANPVSCNVGESYFPQCGVQISWDKNGTDGLPTTFNKAWPEVACYKTQWDETFKMDCCTGKRDSWLYCDPTWCPSDPAGSCSTYLASQCSGVSDIGIHKFLTVDPANSGDVPCAAWYDSVIDGIQSCALLPSAASKTQCLNVYGAAAALIEVEIDAYCGAGGVGAASGECACLHAYTNCADKMGTTYDSEECLLGQHIPGSPAQSGVQRLDFYCNPGDFLNAGNALYSFSGGACDPNAGGGGSNSGSNSGAFFNGALPMPPTLNRLLGSVGGIESLRQIVPSNIDYNPDGTLDETSADPLNLRAIRAAARQARHGPLSSGLGSGGVGDTNDFAGGLPIHCWHPACQYDSSRVFKSLVDLQRPCPSICAQQSSGNYINVGWSQANWMEAGDNTLSCNFGNPQQKLATPFVFADGCESMAIALPANATATIPFSFSNISSESHASFSTLSYSMYSSLNAKVYFSPPTGGNIVSQESVGVVLNVDTWAMTPGTSFQGFLTIQPQDGFNGQAYTPFQLSILPDGYEPTLPTQCSADAAWSKQIPSNIFKEIAPPPAGAFAHPGLNEQVGARDVKDKGSSSMSAVYVLLVALLVAAFLMIGWILVRQITFKHRHTP